MTNPTPRSFPVPRPPEGQTDQRFTFGLMIDVRNVLIAHGYPQDFTDLDLVALNLALFEFIYGGTR